MAKEDRDPERELEEEIDRQDKERAEELFDDRPADFGADIEAWSEAEVCTWLKHVGFSRFVPTFAEEEVIIHNHERFSKNDLKVLFFEQMPVRKF